MAGYHIGTRKRDNDGLRSVILIYVSAVLACLGAVWYADRCIDSVVTVPRVYGAYTAPTFVGSPDSSSDLLQTASGSFVYQRSDYGVEFVQGGEDNTVYVLQEAR